MQDRNWWIGGWRDSCLRCGLEIEDDASIYCSNCGKFLGKIRGTLIVPIIVSICFFAAVGLLVAMWLGGLEPQDPTELTGLVIALSAFGVLSLFVPIPLGRSVLRREKWEKEATRRNEEELERKVEEDRAERVLSVDGKADRMIDIQINAGGPKELEHYIRRLREGMKQALAGSRKKRFPLMAGSGFTQTRLGTIEIDSDGPIRAQIDEGWGSLHYFLNAKGVLENFFLEPITKPIAHDHRKARVEARLPVRNGPALRIEIEDSPDNQESLEDIKRNLEDVYQWKGDCRLKKEQMPEFVHRINMPALPGHRVTRLRIVDDGSGGGQFPQFGFEVEVQRIDDSNSMSVGFSPKKEFKYSGQVLQWEELGHSEGPCYEAASPYHDDGSPFMFRIRMEKSTRLWYLDHDAELMRPKDKEERFNMIDAAMMHCEVARSEILIEEMEKANAANQCLRDRPDIYYQILDSLFIHGEAFVYDGEVLDPAKVVIHRKKKELSEDLKEAVERRVKSLMLLIRAGSFPLIAMEVRKLVESGLKFAGEGPLVKAARDLMGPVESTVGTPIEESFSMPCSQIQVEDIALEEAIVKADADTASTEELEAADSIMTRLSAEQGMPEDDYPYGDPAYLGCGEEADEDFGPPDEE